MVNQSENGDFKHTQFFSGGHGGPRLNNPNPMRCIMDVEKNEVVIVLDCGMELAEVAVEGACCKGKPSLASSTDPIRS